MNKPRTITLALTGASGMPYGLRLLESLLQSGQHVYLLYSKVAQIVVQQEMNLTLPSQPREAETFLKHLYGSSTGQLKVFGRESWYSPVASGTNPADAMVICPCTMGTLAAIATGLSQNLIERAADVMLKEKRQLILVPRETPFSTVHLENMLKLSNVGAVILPANPGFYHHPQTLQDIIDFIVARILDHLAIKHQLIPRWGEKQSPPTQ
ncbi:flavin prenyltransferase UbiX [Nitrosomonas sp.]|uniref:flavin prenyltransferase UbiX n=1 Tax=Nitrosomonas sp. TaxID=42353 RepID=UPI001D9A5681|nr:flavin prenyltransferase UbiX [Nitrosomonas sp.]MCB1949292.1 UbiX family flavin prenyltransferase [Nitrosomonas sp.]MCP5242307.1 UbiX family flavin prenyltransferase [Burkholderiales bacterium]MDR4514776.1 UbiX family flavin prenyltransferase [Nitrosomonas sp.]